jgi:uncharacterized membrane protein
MGSEVLSLLSLRLCGGQAKTEFESVIFKYPYINKVTMKVHRIVASCAVLLMLLMLLPVQTANAQDYIEYKVRIEQNNSATWLITKVSDVTAPIDTWDNFQTRIYDLVDNAAATTKRPMAIDEKSLQINTTVSASSKTTEYMFIWQNFSTAQNGELTFGDVFVVNDFFTQLYGEASLQINYPPDFTVKSVTPEPNSQDETDGMLRWYRTQDLENNPAKIVLAQTSEEVTQNVFTQQPLLIAAVSVTGVAIAATFSFFTLKRRRQSAKASPTKETTVQIETEEDKILNALRASKGSMRQSDITDQCRFSKAKTSQLLTALEKRGVVTRHKSGRDKIVTLNNGVKGEK